MGERLEGDGPLPGRPFGDGLPAHAAGFRPPRSLASPPHIELALGIETGDAQHRVRLEGRPLVVNIVARILRQVDLYSAVRSVRIRL